MNRVYAYLRASTVEQADRIGRLIQEGWTLLKQVIVEKGINVVSLNLPMSQQFIKHDDEFTRRG